MDDKVIVAIIALGAAIFGGILSGVFQYLVTRRKVQSEDMKVGLEILKERIDRIEQVKNEHLQAQRTEDEGIKAANDAPTVVALGAMASVRIGRTALRDYGYLFPEAKVQELSEILVKIKGCMRKDVEELVMADEDPIDLSFKFNDEIEKLMDDELRSLGQMVDRILLKSIS